MEVIFFTGFSKAPDSTRRPLATAATRIFDGQIKGDFSPAAPVLRFRDVPADSMPEWRYCRIEEFKRFYFCSWAFVSGQWEASLVCDVLGTYARQIKSTSQFVARSQSEYDQYIIDGAAQTTGNVEFALAGINQSELWGADYADGTYVIGVIASDVGSQLSPRNVGAVVYYAMSKTGFSVLMYSLLRSPAWMNIDTSEISENLQKALINPAQYIVSAVWLPISATEFIKTPSDPEVGGDVVTTIKLGWWSFEIGHNCRVLHQPTSDYDSYSKWLLINYSLHPDTNTYGAWVNLAPYTKITLDFPPFGCIDLDTTDLLAHRGIISCHVFVHAYSGDATLLIFSGDARPGSTSGFSLVATMRASIGVQLPVGQIAVNAGNFKNAVVAGGAAGLAEIADIWKED